MRSAREPLLGLFGAHTRDGSGGGYKGAAPAALDSPTALVLAEVDDDGQVRTSLSATLSSWVLAALQGRLRPAVRAAVTARAGLGEQISYLPVRLDVVVECRVDAARCAGGFRHRVPVQRVRAR